MPSAISPMKATLVSDPPRGDDWLFEIKWDGIRAVCFIENEQATLVTRNGNDCTRQYPELTLLPHYIAADRAILDGEIAVLDSKGVSKFELIQPRIANSDPNAVAHMSRSNPVTLFLFDLIYLDGYDLTRVTVAERKETLKQILTETDRIRFCEHFAGVGEEMLELARNTGLEGLIAKHANSCYEQKRSREWLKLKVVAEQEFVICGFTEGEREHFASLVLGVYEDGKLRYVGNVGTGFDAKKLSQLASLMEPRILKKSPFAERDPKLPPRTTFVKPELVAQIKFANWTNDNKLRAPVYLGLREDVRAKEVQREQPADTEDETPKKPAGKRSRPLLKQDLDEANLTIDGRELRFTNLGKIFYPDDGVTKRDVINHYDAVFELIEPHIHDRPLSLKRFPNGISEEHFFQKDIKSSQPKWLYTVPIQHEENSKPTNYVIANDRPTLLYLANLSCIDQNPWMSRIGSLDNPDFILIDLDPVECPYDMIVEAAILVRKKLEQIELEGYPKTTGGDGMHIYIPVEPIYSFEETKTFAELIANLVIAEAPHLFTTPRSVAKRQKNRVYFDYLQNARVKTISAPYVLRAYPGAPVATPLAWREVKKGLDPKQFHIKNCLKRFDKLGDVFAPVLTNLQTLDKAMERLEELLSERSR